MTTPRDHEQPLAGTETLFIWMRGDIQKLGEMIERLSAVVGNLEVRVAPMLTYQQPCPTLLDYMRRADARSEREQSWWSRLGLELLKYGVISLVSAVLVLWVAHSQGAPAGAAKPVAAAPAAKPRE